MKNYILLSVLLISFSSELSSQMALQKDKEISVMVGATSTMINNYNIRHDKSFIVDNKNGADFRIEYSQYFFDRVGLGTGFGLSNYNQVYYQKGLFRQPNQVDKNGVVYEKWTSSNVKYSNKLMYANVPVTVHVLIGGSSRCYVYADAGVINHFLIKGSYAESGTIETMGKYPSESGHPDWWGLTADNEYYDYKSVSVSEKDDQKYRTYNLSGHLAVGVAAAIHNSVYLKVQPFVNAGLLDIMNKDEQGSEYVSVSGEKSSYKPTRLFSCGISVGCAFSF